MFRRSRLDPAQLHLALQFLRSARRVVALTGAGISTPSGIPDFRSTVSGLWNQIDPMEVASVWGFYQRPQRFYEWMRPLARAIVQARPNAAHRALAEMERVGKLAALVTQNIDGLHQQAGSMRVLELHGHLRSVTCLKCRYVAEAAAYLHLFTADGDLPVCPHCAFVLKPTVVLFGEPLPEDDILAAQEETLRSDLLLVAGSSLEVMPAADLPALAQRRGAKLILVNMGPTPFDHLADVVLRGDVADVLPKLVAGLKE